MIFLQFRAFPRNCRILCWLGSAPNTKTGFLCACRLVAGKGFITVWKQCHSVVSYTLQIYQTFNPLPAPYPVVLKGPERLAFIVGFFDISAGRITGERQELYIFFPISTQGIVLTPAVIQKNAFRIFGAEEEPAASIPVFGECDNNINHPFPLQSGEHRAHADLPVPGFGELKHEIFWRQTFPVFPWAATFPCALRRKVIHDRANSGIADDVKVKVIHP